MASEQERDSFYNRTFRGDLPSLELFSNVAEESTFGYDSYGLPASTFAGGSPTSFTASTTFAGASAFDSSTNYFADEYLQPFPEDAEAGHIPQDFLVPAQQPALPIDNFAPSLSPATNPAFSGGLDNDNGGSHLEGDIHRFTPHGDPRLCLAGIQPWEELVVYGDDLAANDASFGPINTMSPSAISYQWKCLWHGCSTIWNSESEVRTHIKIHVEYGWSGATTCQWPDCTSKACFGTAKLLSEHILNIHIIPLLCTIPTCSYKKPFGKVGDLRRHIETIHGKERKYKCPAEDCSAHTAGFARKDKLLKHIREGHPRFKCGYNHCLAKVRDWEKEHHLSTSHGVFECAMGGCENARKSSFTEWRLRWHLEESHSIPYGQAYDLVTSTQDATARSELGKACETCSSASR